MPTYKIYIAKGQQRKSDGKFPVSIRITHRRERAYLKTDYYVVTQQLTKSFELKDMVLMRHLLDLIDGYDRLLIDRLGNRMAACSVKDLAECIKRRSVYGREIDFISFAAKHIGELRSNGRDKRAKHIQTAIRAVMDFTARKELCIKDVTADFLTRFERFLRSERVIVRENQYGKEVEIRRKPLTDVGVHDYMADIRAVFNAAAGFYNNEDLGDMVISHYPFRKYKIVQPSVSRKRNLQPGFIRQIMRAEGCCGRAELGRDVFMLSFFLVGMNTVDLFKMEEGCLRDGRLTYRRSKTEGRRRDRALISIRVEPEMAALFERYADPDGKRVFDFYKRYANHDVFNAAVNKGLKQVAAALGFKENLTAYVARHSWATIARNRLDVGVDDIALCLNHVSEAHRVTDVYIEKDFSRIDAVNRRMLDLLFGVDGDKLSE